MAMKTKLKLTTITLALLFAVLFGATSAGAQAPDEDFAMKAAAAGNKEVRLGRIASRRARSGAVKSFGTRMIADHTSAGNKLKAIAARKRINLPAGLDADGKDAVDRLSSLSGREFDRAYLEMMVMDHEKAVADFEAEANSGSDRQLRSFARQTLPTLRMHLRMARDGGSRMR
jgi:putative membrane protein